MMDWVTGIAGSAIIAGIAYRKRSLSLSGMIAAVLVGTVLYALGSAPWFGTLIAFFVSSSFLSKWKQKAKEQLETAYEKTGRRDAGQVFANGGLGVLLCAAYSVWPNPFWWNAFLGVMAAVNADTWATEIGGLSKTPPRSILTGKKVPAGTSGGVSVPGTIASVAGGLFIGIVAWLLLTLFPDPMGNRVPAGSTADFMALLLTSAAAGTAGSLTDSVLGASVQAMYRCTSCGREVERRIHCGQPAGFVRGWRFFNNDRVNVLGSVIGGTVAVLLG